MKDLNGKEKIAMEAVVDFLIESEAPNYIGANLDTQNGPVEIVARYVTGKTPQDKLTELENRITNSVEDVARAIYRLLPGDDTGSPSDFPWREGGNSDMQYLARDMARAALAVLVLK